MKPSKLCFALINLLLLGIVSRASEPPQTNKPFPQHAIYTKNTIKPNHKTQQQLDADVAMVYERWKKNYLTEDIGTKGLYYIKYQKEAGKPVTVSEAHGYGMVTMVYMAGADKDAKTYFDGMYHFFKAHPSNGNPKLMNWQQSIKNGKVVSVGGSCATDGDMDIAYALLLADQQWGSKGEINYKAEALTIINALKASILHSRFRTLKMGDWASQEGSRINDGTRPSDFMLQHMKAYKNASQDAVWDTVETNTYKIVNYIFNTYSPNTGLMPDFAEYKNGNFVPANGQLLEDPNDGSYSYNSARTPWRIATDYLTTGDNRAQKQLTTLNSWIKKNSSENPSQIYSGYRLDGTVLNNRTYQDLTYQAPFLVSAMIDNGNQQWVNKLWDNAVNNHNSYFGDSITMLCLITASGNWWIP
ncbi:glycosyl hydrolase family 8 [Pedobacter sp. MC2016-24]|uniref:glycosyl hydrolase family 8 n=1 Tax=Pedobacter sp. MC2016-24 TaxID=2780090 RepID=UPI001881F9B5|nr:glycosyl hydrolase family 8 [Pedobacter sp. MC2016-24]MBE9603176.1 beta-glucanase [Pedobacter sp. MC2016-24]